MKVSRTALIALARYVIGWLAGYYAVNQVLGGDSENFALSVAGGWWAAFALIVGMRIDRRAVFLLALACIFTAIASQYLRFEFPIHGPAASYYAMTTLVALAVLATPLFACLLIQALLKKIVRNTKGS
jgi:hypothetical protein